MYSIWTINKSTTFPTWTDLGANPGLCGKRPAINRPNHGRVSDANILCIRLCWRSRGSSVSSLTTDWTTGRSGFDPRQGQRIFPLTSVSWRALRPTQPPVRWVPGFFPRGKARQRRDADHSPPSSAQARMSRSYTSSPPSATMACSWTALLCFCFLCLCWTNWISTSVLYVISNIVFTCVGLHIVSRCLYCEGLPRKWFNSVWAFVWKVWTKWNLLDILV
jgi:hypothetical protein